MDNEQIAELLFDLPYQDLNGNQRDKIKQLQKLIDIQIDTERKNLIKDLRIAIYEKFGGKNG